MPVRVKSKGAHVTVPATARAVKDLVAAGDGATEDPHGSPDICARRRGVGAARFSRLPCGPGAWSERGVALAPASRMFAAATRDSRCRFPTSPLRMPAIRAAQGTAALPPGCSATRPRLSRRRRSRPRSLQPGQGPQVRRKVSVPNWRPVALRSHRDGRPHRSSRRPSVPATSGAHRAVPSHRPHEGTSRRRQLTLTEEAS